MAICLFTLLHGQSPESFSYQAILRNAAGGQIVNQTVTCRFSILSGNPTGTLVYREKHVVTTNYYGLASLAIGSGTDKTGDFSSIDWSANAHFLKVEVDLSGTGSTFIDMGTTQIMSVPYSLYSKKAGFAMSADYNDILNRPVLFDGNYQSLLNKPTLFSGNYSDLLGKPDLFNGSWSSLTDKPTTIVGYGITDAVTVDGSQLIAGAKSFSKPIDLMGNRVLNVAEPTVSTDAATKEYVDKAVTVLQDAMRTLVTGLRDIEGRDYKVVLIGDQLWMAENLKVTKFNDGTGIPLVSDNLEWSSLNGPGYCVYASNYGAIYNWFVSDPATNGNRNVCPVGWHVPTDEDWTKLENFLIGSGFNYDGSKTGNKIAKSLGATTSWFTSAVPGSVGSVDFQEYRNKTGFSAIAGGNRMADGTYSTFDIYGYWWSGTDSNITNSIYRGMRWDGVNIFKASRSKQSGLYIRCIKD